MPRNALTSLGPGTRGYARDVRTSARPRLPVPLIGYPNHSGRPHREQPPHDIIDESGRWWNSWTCVVSRRCGSGGRDSRCRVRGFRAAGAVESAVVPIDLTEGISRSNAHGATNNVRPAQTSPRGLGNHKPDNEKRSARTVAIRLACTHAVKSELRHRHSHRDRRRTRAPVAGPCRWAGRRPGRLSRCAGL